MLYGRSVATTDTFDLPKDLLNWQATCHHNNPRLMEMADEFMQPGDDLRLFYIWGHSYEFDIDRNWRIMEDFCAKMGGLDDVWYATNGEIALWMKENRLT